MLRSSVPGQWLGRFLVAAAVTVLSSALHATSYADEPISGGYSMDPTHTSVVFKVDHLGFSTYIGRFDTAAGTLSFDEKDPAKSSVSVTIDASSVNTNSEALEEKLRGADMFDAEAHPEITFVSTSIETTGEATGKITGNLTIAGMTKPVTLDVTFNNGAPHPFPPNKFVLGFSATAALKRSEWELNSWLPAVGDDVALEIEAEFVKDD